VCDAERRAPSHPDYDKRTLHVPAVAYNQMTAFEQQVCLCLSTRHLVATDFSHTQCAGQYWDVKRAHFDTVVFFKKGKFYELYEMDAGMRAHNTTLCEFASSNVVA
jgi:DNA mismatch repair protein MSH6